MTDPVWYGARGWSRGWRPEPAGLLVAQVERLAGRVDERVVRPGRQAVLLAVGLPGGAGAALRDDEPEGRVGDHVHPRRRRVRAGRQVDDVLAPVGREPARAVPELPLQP